MKKIAFVGEHGEIEEVFISERDFNSEEIEPLREIETIGGWNVCLYEDEQVDMGIYAATDDQGEINIKFITFSEIQEIIDAVTA